MAVLIFRLNDVSEEEAQDVRDLLTDHQLECYETSAGRWGISVAGIWLINDSEAAQARALIDEYQRQRQCYFNDLKQDEAPETFLDRLKRAPMLVIVYSLLAALVLYISLSPFIGFFAG